MLQNGVGWITSRSIRGTDAARCLPFTGQATNYATNCSNCSSCANYSSWASWASHNNPKGGSPNLPTSFPRRAGACLFQPFPGRYQIQPQRRQPRGRQPIVPNPGPRPRPSVVSPQKEYSRCWVLSRQAVATRRGPRREEPLTKY